MNEPFDFDAFIAGTQLARGPVSFYRVDHRVQIQQLTAEHDAAPAEGGDERESDQTPARHALAERIAALRAEMEASRVTLTLRTLTPDEYREITRDDALDIYDQLEWMSKAPKGSDNPAAYSDLPQLTRAQWKAVADRIGTAQFAVIVADANALVESKVAVPDFSPSVSKTLRPPAPSAS
jgi:hypothetical protein